MKALAYGLVLAGATLPSIAHAQVKIDMNLVTCAQYIAMPPDQAANFAAWMSGWFNQKQGSSGSTYKLTSEMSRT